VRNALTHFDAWALGDGRGPQKQKIGAGSEPRDVAGHFWGFGYYSGEHSLRLGPYEVPVAAAVCEAHELAIAIYIAANEVDRQQPVRLAGQ